MKFRVVVVLAALSLAGCATSAPVDDPGADVDGAHDAGPEMGPILHHAPIGELDRSVEGLPRAQPMQEVRLADGDTMQLTATPVAHDPGVGRLVRMWAYNGQIPGPQLRVPVGARVTVDLVNDLPLPTTVHWHGMRGAPDDDGVPGLSQEPVPPGGTFRYSLVFPDEGVVWYHPHVREDVEQDLGLLGVIVVEGPRALTETWPEERVLVLDDLLVKGDDVAPFPAEGSDRVLMGRYGDQLLLNGEDQWSTTAAAGERVRLVLLNGASARPFSLRFPGATTVERIGADIGYYVSPLPLEGSLFISPSERRIVDVVMPPTGEVTIVNHIPEGDAVLGRILVEGEVPAVDTGAPVGPHERARASLEDALLHAADPVDVTWDLAMRVLDLAWARDVGIIGSDFRHPRHDLRPTEWPPGIAWTDFVPTINANATTARIDWVIRDGATLDENLEANYTFAEGSYAKLRLRNPAVGPNHMQHPIHLHGQRFLVVSLDGVPDAAPVWRDTVMVPTASEAVILVEMANPGRWLYHCHIAEHMETGMMGTLTVA